MNKPYCGILFFGQNAELAGRGIAGPRLRTAANKNGFNVLTTDITTFISVEKLYNILEHNITEETKFIGFSCSWIDIPRIQDYCWYNQEFFNTVRQKWPNVLIITGGHDEFNKNFLLKNSDYHFHGYSDNSFVEFLKLIHNESNTLVKKRHIFGKGFYIDSNLDHQVLDPNELETIFIKEDNFKHYQPLPIEIGRGCIFRCGFCRHPFQGKKEYDSYQRTPENIASEFERNYDLFGTTRYVIVDDTFNDSIEKITRVQRAIEISKIPKFEFVSYIKPELLVTKPEMISMLVDTGLRGAFIGFESFDNKARQVIGKGTKIEKVLDACRKLCSIKDQVLLHGSFIVGLPCDTVENIENTFKFLTGKENDFIKSWHFEGLSVREYEFESDSRSIFDKKAADYGFKFTSNNGWSRNDGWNSLLASELAYKYNTESIPFKKVGGWRVAGCWHLGLTDAQINKNFLDINVLLMDLKFNGKVRAFKEYQRLINKFS